jgi:radical SAM superfamily enzyme YgiQ (UPF0313 family)
LICLITPPSGFLLDERVFLSLGILRVAAVLEKACVPVEMLDLSGIVNFEDVLAQHQTAAGVFGITATSPQMPAVTRIVAVLRKVHPKTRIILGGPHATLVHAARRKEVKRGAEGRACRAWAKLESSFDCVVVGDGEEAIFHALRPDAPRLIDADDPQAPLFLTNQRLNELPFPARHLVDVSTYHYTIDGMPSLSMVAQLGCPFACAFCGGRYSPMLRRIRTRTTENILAEVRHLHETYGVRGIMFYDDELNVNKGVVSLMDGIASLGLDLRLRGFVKAELFTAEQAEAMYRAGFRWLLVGFESGSPRILENINKKATREDNTNCLRLAHAAGLKVKALMSVGHPGESRETIADTREWLLAEKPDDFDCTVITTYGGTPYYDDAVETRPGVWTYTARSGDKLHAYETDFETDSSYYKGIPGEYKSHVFTDHISAEGLVEARDRLEAEVREKLGIPYNAGQPGVRFEASMGQLPGHILRKSNADRLLPID